MKKKITMIISIGAVSLILTMLMVVQFKTVDETDIMAIETMRETELRAELANWKKKYEEVDLEIQEREQRISEYKGELANDADAAELLANEVKEAETFLGGTTLHGQGIKVLLTGKDIYDVKYYHLLDLVNDLNTAGAEAISINDQRIVNMSDIMVVNEASILVNSVKISEPYEVKAIGDKKYLESALTIKTGYIDKYKFDINVEYTVEDDVIIKPYDINKLNFEYAQEYKEQEEK